MQIALRAMSVVLNIFTKNFLNISTDYFLSHFDYGSGWGARKGKMTKNSVRSKHFK